MSRTMQITTDVAEAVNVGLDVYDVAGDKVGRVDSFSGTRGWMQVASGGLEIHVFWVPYRLVKSVDARELFLNVSKMALRADYMQPPPRTVETHRRNGRTTAVTTEPNGYDGEPIVVNRVDIDDVAGRLRTGQGVWSADDADLGTVAQIDAAAGYMMVERGVPPRRHDAMIPLHAIAEVDADDGIVTLSVREADLNRR